MDRERTLLRLMAHVNNLLSMHNAHEGQSDVFALVQGPGEGVDMYIVSRGRVVGALHMSDNLPEEMSIEDLANDMFNSIVRDLGGQRAIEGSTTAPSPVRGIARLFSREVAAAVAGASGLSLSQLVTKGLAVSICDRLSLLIVDCDRHGETTLSDEDIGLNALPWPDIRDHTITYHMRYQPGAILSSIGREPTQLLYVERGGGVEAVVVYPYTIGIAQTLSCRVDQVGYLVDIDAQNFCAFAINRDLGGRALQYALDSFATRTIYAHSEHGMLTSVGVLHDTGRIVFKQNPN